MVWHSPVQSSKNVFLDLFTVGDVRMYRLYRWQWKLVLIKEICKILSDSLQNYIRKWRKKWLCVTIWVSGSNSETNWPQKKKAPKRNLEKEEGAQRTFIVVTPHKSHILWLFLWQQWRWQTQFLISAVLNW